MKTGLFILGFTLLQYSPLGMSAVITGSLTTTDVYDNGILTGFDTTIDRWDFSVGSNNTTVNFDVLAWENINGSDLNGDGEWTAFDSVIKLFNADTNEFLGSIDDGPLGTDGSVVNSVVGWGTDSNGDWTFLNAGTYFLTIGEFDYLPADALVGHVIKNETYCGPVRTIGSGESSSYYTVTDSGSMGATGGGHCDYQITITGDAVFGTDPGTGTNVPEPSIIALFGLGLLGLGLTRRRLA